MAQEVIEVTEREVEIIEVIERGPAGPAGAGISTLTTKGDLLYRGETTGERLPIGSSGQILKVSATGIPEWGAAPSSGVSSVNGQTGVVVLDAADVGAAADDDPRLSDTRDPNAHAASHAAGEADELFNQNLNTTDSVQFDGGIAAGATPTQYFPNGHPNELLAPDGGGYPPLFLAGGSGCVEFWDTVAGTSHYGSFGLAIPGGSVGADFKFGTYQGSWQERFAIKNAEGGIAIAGVNTEPSTPVAGQIYYNSDENKFYGYNGTAWIWLDIAAPADIGAAAASHTHELSDITDAGTAAAEDSTAFAPASHTHPDATTTVAGFLSASDKTKLDGIASGAEVNVQADWTQSNNAADDFIKNKPTLGTAAAASTSDFAPSTGISPSAISGTAVVTSDARLSDARTPLSHTHGNITNDGKVGSTANLPLITTTAGTVTTGAFGTGATDFAAGNHTHAASAITSGTLDTARLGSGSASASTYLRGDSTWASVSSSNMTGATSSAAGAAGLVPSPSAGDEEKMLTGAGTFHVPNVPIIKTQTSRGTTTSRWIVAPYTQAESGGSTGGANYEFCGGYVYVPYTGSFYFATIPAAAYSTNTKTCWALYNLASDGLPGTLAVTLGELDVGAGSNVLCESASTVSLTKGWYCCVSRANASFNLWSPQSANWLNYIVGKPTSDLTSSGANGKRRFYRSLTYSTSFSSDLTSTNWSEDASTPPCCWIRRG